MYIFQVVTEDAQESTTDGYEVPVKGHYDNIEDEDEVENKSMNQQQNESRNYAELNIPAYENIEIY